MPVKTLYDTELAHVFRAQYFAQCYKIRTEQYKEFCHNQSLPRTHLSTEPVPANITFDFKKYLFLQRDFYTQSFSADFCLLHQILSPSWSSKISTQCVCGFLLLNFNNTIFNGMTRQDWRQCLINLKQKGFLICVVANHIPSKTEEIVFQTFIYEDLLGVVDCVLVSEILLPKWILFDFLQKFIKGVYGLIYQPFQFILIDDNPININARRYGFHVILAEEVEHNKTHAFVEFLANCPELPLPTFDVRHRLCVDEYAADFLDISVEWWGETKDFRDGFAHRGPSFLADRLERFKLEKFELERDVPVLRTVSVRPSPLLKALQERNRGYIRRTDVSTREQLIASTHHKIHAITHPDGFEKIALTTLEMRQLALYKKELRMLSGET